MVFYGLPLWQTYFKHYFSLLSLDLVSWKVNLCIQCIFFSILCLHLELDGWDVKYPPNLKKPYHQNWESTQSSLNRARPQRWLTTSKGKQQIGHCHLLHVCHTYFPNKVKHTQCVRTSQREVFGCRTYTRAQWIHLLTCIRMLQKQKKKVGAKTCRRSDD